MSTPSPPSWLAPLQGQLGALLSAPPTVQEGRLRVPPPPPALLDLLAPSSVSLTAQVSIYQEQCWMRFFQVAQGQHPYTVRAIGPWEMNKLAMIYLQQSPPQGRSLERLYESLYPTLHRALWRLLTAVCSSPGVSPPPLRSLVNALPHHLELRALRQSCPVALQKDPWVQALLALKTPVELLDQALRLDKATSDAFASPPPTLWTPSAQERSVLPQLQLQVPRSLSVLKESWLTLAVDQKRNDSQPHLSQAQSGLRRHSPSRLWVSWRAPQGPALLQLSPSAAALLEGSKKSSLNTLREGLKRRRLPPVSEQEFQEFIERGLSYGWWLAPQSPLEGQAPS